MPYEERLEILKLPSLEDRRKRGDLIQTFKLLKGFYSVNVADLFESDYDESRRGHPWKLKKNRWNTRKRGSFLTNRVIEAWNALPHEAVNAQTINNFKNNLDKLELSKKATDSGYKKPSQLKP